MALSPWDPRWDPFPEMTSLRDAMNRLWETSFVPWSTASGQGGMPALDVSETDDEYVVMASLPGVKPEDVKLSVQNNMLTIAGECCRDEERKEGERSLQRERRHGTFSRSISLPAAVDADRANAQFEHGCLRLTLPKAEAARPRQIPIGRQQTAIEGEQVHREGVEVPDQKSAETGAT
jgi:HSP20 family protein